MASGQNNTGNELTLRQITAPGLGQAGYGRHMEQTFENIDDNFKILGNRDFVKGDQGYSLRSVPVRFIDNDGIFTEDGIQVLKAILSINDVDTTFLDTISRTKSAIKTALDAHPDTSVHSTTNASLVDYITTECVINRIEVYDPANPTDFDIVGTTNDPVFKDARFVHAEDYQSETYSDLYDFTCTVHLAILEKNGGYEVGYQILQNYPTLYYDRGQGNFCWKVFGVPTGIIAQGPKGTNGAKATMHIVCGEWTNENGIPSFDAATTIPIKKVLVDGTWIDASTVIQEDWIDDACIMFALRPTTGSAEDAPVYPFAFASTISQCTPGYGAYCDQANSIQMDQDATLIRSAFLGISYTEGSLLHALFVPIGSVEGSNDFNHTPVHAIWAAPVNGVGQGVKYELHITPFKSYNEIAVVGRELSNMPAPTSDSASEARLRVIDGHRFDPPTGDYDRIQLDYPQVIITGPLEDNIPTAALGVGTSYMDPLLDVNTAQPMGVSRIKVGTKGVVQIGANRDGQNNNKGSLIVSNIYSSLKAIAQSNDGGCALNLIGTNNEINLGSANSGDRTTANIYGDLFVKSDNAKIKIVDTVSSGSSTRPYITLDSETGSLETLGTSPYVRLVDMAGNAPMIYLHRRDIQHSGYGEICKLSFGSSTLNINVDYSSAPGEWRDNLLKNFNIRTDASRINLNPWKGATSIPTGTELGDTVLSSIYCGTRKTLPTQTVALWEGAANATEITEDVSIPASQFKPDGYSPTKYTTVKGKITGSVPSKTITVTISRKVTKYLEPWDLHRDCTLNLILYVNGTSYTLCNSEVRGSGSWNGNKYVSTHTFSISSKTISQEVPKGASVYVYGWISWSIGWKYFIAGSYSEEGTATYSFSNESWKINLQNKGKRSDATGAEMKTVYGNGWQLMGVNRHRAIGLYTELKHDNDSTYKESGDISKDKLNESTGLFLTFKDYDDNECWCTISAAQLFAAVNGGKLPTDQSVVSVPCPSGTPIPGKLYQFP